MQLVDVTRVIRSKNAGPLQVTLDIMFDQPEIYARAVAAPSLQRDAVAALYGVAAETVTVLPFKAALAIKIVLDRPVVAGTPGDSDVYGAQQHAPLLGIAI
jgi:hypothetical protein